MRTTKIIFLLFLVAFVFFVFYINKYQLLVSEGSKLAEEYCQIIDPVLFNKQS